MICRGRLKGGGTDNWNSLAKGLGVGFGIARAGGQGTLLAMARGKAGNVSYIPAGPLW